MAGFPWRLVTVDIDGTLTRVHGWKPIATAFGREIEFGDEMARFYAREIGEDEHLARLVNLARGHTIAEVLEVVAGTPKIRGVSEAVGELHTLGARAAILSHNPGYVIDYYRRTFGFDDGDGFSVPVDPTGLLAPVRAVRADKVAGLAELLRRTGVRPREVAHVGDGWADARVFRQVGGGISLNSPLAEVDRAADRAVRTDDLREVVRVLRALEPRG